MKNILFALLFIPLLSGKPLTVIVTNDCNSCPVNSSVKITCSGFTPGKYIAVVIHSGNGNIWSEAPSGWPNVITDANGNAIFYYGITPWIGSYTLDIYEVRNSKSWKQWDYKASTSFEIN